MRFRFRLLWEFRDFWHHHHHHHHHQRHHKAKDLNLRLFTLTPEGDVLMAGSSVTVVGGKSVLFAISPTDASGNDASADVPSAGVAFSLSDPSVGSITLNPDGYTGTIATVTVTAVKTATLNVTAQATLGGTLTDSAGLTVNPAAAPAVALNLKVVATP
jgi:hypothetical protein